MAFYFDEQILKDILAPMTYDGGNCIRNNGSSCRREQFVNGLIDIFAMPERHKRGNRWPNIAFLNLKEAIEYPFKNELTPEQTQKMREHLAKVEIKR